MVKQKKRTCITQLGKNCVFQGARLIWKQKIWLVLTKPYCSLANHNPEFRCVICTLLYKQQWNTKWAFPREFHIFTNEDNMLTWYNVFNSISHSFASLTRAMSSWPLEDKIHIHARTCNILYVLHFLHWCNTFLHSCYTFCTPFSAWTGQWVTSIHECKTAGHCRLFTKQSILIESWCKVLSMGKRSKRHNLLPVLFSTLINSFDVPSFLTKL